MIYFIRIPDGRIKIGVTESFKYRFPVLRREYGESTVFLAIIPGQESEERLLHERFARVRHQGTELFDPTPDLMKFIDGLPDPVIRDAEEAKNLWIDPFDSMGDWVTIAQATRLLRMNPHFVWGVINGMGMEMSRVGRIRVISSRDFSRLRRQVERTREAESRRSG